MLILTFSFSDVFQIFCLLIITLARVLEPGTVYPVKIVVHRIRPWNHM